MVAIRGRNSRSGACPKPLIPLAPEHTQVLRVRTASRELDDMKVIEHDEAHRVWSKPSEPSERVNRLRAMAQARHPSGTLAAHRLPTFTTIRPHCTMISYTGLVLMAAEVTRIRIFCGVGRSSP